MDTHVGVVSGSNYFGPIRDQEFLGGFFNNGMSNTNTVCNYPPHQSPPPQAHTTFTGNNVLSFMNSSPPLMSPTGLRAIAKGHSGRKRKRKDGEEDMERPKEVIHVRAKRGQATDSHSLAERVRREKINERLRCLQELVPGCYKTMGMAVMLDVVINYVQSLQNQIEFLSLKLSAASMHYDFGLEDNNTEKMQGTNAYEVQEMERMAREGYGLWRSF